MSDAERPFPILRTAIIVVLVAIVLYALSGPFMPGPKPKRSRRAIQNPHQGTNPSNGLPVITNLQAPSPPSTNSGAQGAQRAPVPISEAERVAALLILQGH